MCCSLVIAGILRETPDRAGAAWIVPVIAAWLAAPLAVRDTPRAVGWAIAAALAVRLPLVGAPPHLSDDLYRYLWEGAALNAGINPFVTPAAQAPGIAESVRHLVNHPEITSIYPPLALWWFRGLALAGDTPRIAQLGAVLADLVAVAALARSPSGRRAAWIWALHPLPAIEGAVSAHLELPAIALALAGLAMGGAGVFAGSAAAALVKVFPVMVVPAALRALPPRRAAVAVAVAIAATAVLAAPVLSAGPALLHGFDTYARTWSFNGCAYPWVAPWLGPEGARRALGAVGALAVVGATWRFREPAAVWLVAGAAFLVLTPTAHPWYALWVLAPAVWAGRTAWIAAATAPSIGYLVLLTWDTPTARWAEQPWLWWATWAPFAAALAWGHLRSDATPTAP